MRRAHQHFFAPNHRKLFILQGQNSEKALFISPTSRFSLNSQNLFCKPLFRCEKSFINEHVLASSFSIYRFVSLSLPVENDARFESCCISIAESVISKYPTFRADKNDDFAKECSLHDILNLCTVSPSTVRRLWRVSKLKPDDFLEILMDFRLGSGYSTNETKKISFLWKLFKWAKNQGIEFKHLDRSCSIMALMLAKEGFIAESGSLVCEMYEQKTLIDGRELFSKIIEGYANLWQIDKSMEMYNRSRTQGIILFESCYEILLNLLIEMNRSQTALRIFKDMIEVGLVEKLEDQVPAFLVRKLCKNGKIHEVMELLVKIIELGTHPSNVILNEIVDWCCCENNFYELLDFFLDYKIIPSPYVCNKMIHSLCHLLGTEKTQSFLNELMTLGFIPDEKSLGIFVCWSCKEGNVRSALVYLSDLLCRNLKPDVYVYNSLISVMFKEGMGKLVSNVFQEMVETGIEPNAITYRVLLSGYLRDRNFNEMKQIMENMQPNFPIPSSSLKDHLYEAIKFLGMDPLKIKIKRDNDTGFLKTEFFDTLGNGLYIHTDMDWFENCTIGMLNEALVPDFNSMLSRECRNGNLETALRLRDEMIWWGQKLSLSSFSDLLKSLDSRGLLSKIDTEILDDLEDEINHLNQDTLNLFIQCLSKNQKTYKARVMLDRVLKLGLSIHIETYTVLLKSICKEGNLKALNECWELARTHGWIPTSEDCRTLVGHLCKRGLLDKALELFESIIKCYPQTVSQTCKIFLKEFRLMGYTKIGHLLVHELLQRGAVLETSVYNQLIRGYCKENNYAEALKMLDVVIEKDMVLPLDIFRLLIPYLCKFDRLDVLFVLCKHVRIKTLEASNPICNLVVDEFCKLGRFSDAALSFKRIPFDCMYQKNSNLNPTIYAEIHKNDMLEACELLSIIIRRNFSISILSYGRLVQLMCLKGRINYALGLKEIVLRQSGYQDIAVYNILIFYLFQVGAYAHILKILDEMHGRRFVFDNVTYEFLIYGYYRNKDVPRMWEMMTMMIRKNMKPSKRAMRLVVDSLFFHSEMKKALELSTLMESRGWVHGSILQTIMVLGLLSQGQLEEAEAFLTRLEVKDLIPNNVNYDVLITKFCKLGRIKMGSNLLNLMIKKGSTPSGSSYNSIIRALCDRKSLDEALDFYTEMLVKNLEPGVRLSETLIHGLCSARRIENAENVISLLVKHQRVPTVSMYRSVIDGYCLNLKFDEASKLYHQMQESGLVPDFSIQWSLIDGLRNVENNGRSNNKGFLSRLLSESGFSMKGSNAKHGKI